MRLERVVAASVGTFLVGTAMGAFAESTASETTKAHAAFVEAYIYACQPVEYDFAGIRAHLNEAATQVYDWLFLVEYGGSCRDFYFEVVVPRLEVERQPYFLPVGR
jgi:hypothetical protein